MRVGIIQPNFIPWRGYFDFIRSVDLFILLDDVQYTRGDWRARNRVKTQSGARWLSVPVRDTGLDMLTCEARLDHRHPWREKHLRTWPANYANAPHYSALRPLLDALYAYEDEKLVDLNIRMIRTICEYLNIRTPLIVSSDLGIHARRTEKVVGLLRAVGATRYLSGPSADSYLDKTLFERAEISLEYKRYDYATYPQLWGDFDGAVTVLDLIANCGPSSIHHLTSRSPDQMMVSPFAQAVTCS